MMDANTILQVREARAAGIRALNSLRAAQKHLDSARNWGVLDLIGGGLISSLVKHAKVDDAQRYIEKAQCDLDDFRDELRDVNLPDVQIDGFMLFADFFFDGLLADLLVQRRINEARARLQSACLRVEEILRQLPEA